MWNTYPTYLAFFGCLSLLLSGGFLFPLSGLLRLLGQTAEQIGQDSVAPFPNEEAVKLARASVFQSGNPFLNKPTEVKWRCPAISSHPHRERNGRHVQAWTDHPFFLGRRMRSFHRRGYPDIHTCAPIYIYICMCIYVYIYIYINQQCFAVPQKTRLGETGKGLLGCSRKPALEHLIDNGGSEV